MSDMALELIRRAKAEGWKRLDLGNCGIKGALPDEICELNALEELYLGSDWFDTEHSQWIHHNENRQRSNHEVLNEIEDFPPRIGELKNLRVLNCQNAYMRSAQHLDQLTNLKSLSFSTGYNLRLPRLDQLTKLEVFEVYGYREFWSLSSISSCINLVRINIRHTAVSDLLPLAQLEKLESLDLTGTKIVDVSPLARLPKLQFLNLALTPIESIEPLRNKILEGLVIELGECRQLTNPPYEIAQEGTDAILKYWEDLEKGQKFKRYLNRDVQLILIGNSDAGKSTLAKYLTTGQLSNGHPSTHGMDTVVWEPNFEIGRLKDEEANPEGRCRVRILDFGGQEYYHDTHHLFFNDNTAFVLLWNHWGNKIAEVSAEILLPDNDTKERVFQQNYPLQYWLDAIEFHCETRLSRLAWDYANAKAREITSWVREHNRWGRSRMGVVSGYWRSTHSIMGWINRGINYLSPNFLGVAAKPPLFAPTIVVQNKIDRDDLVFIAQDRLKVQFEFIYDFAAISLNKEHPRRLEQLKLLIEEIFSEMRIVGSELPVQYGWVKDAVEVFQSTEYEMAVADFESWANGEISKQNKARSLQLDKESIELLINYLKRIGLVLYYPDKPDLADRVFLQPDKVLKGIYEILRGVGAKGGRFDDPHALNAEVDGDAATLLLLMRQFKIIFLEGGQAGKYVAPLYLNPKPIQGVQLFLDLFQKPVYRIQYAAFIHKSVVLHFFEVFGPRAYREETLGGQELYYYWRNGIVIKDERSDARVLVQFFIGEEDERRPEGFVPAHIDIFLLGAAESSRFLQGVLATMEAINKGWNTTVMVTHNGEDFVPLEVVEKAAEEKQFTFFYEDRIFQLIDFRKFIKIKMPMKKVFISYSKTDVEFLQQLESHLAVFKRNGHIATWTDRKLSPGEAWDGKIKQELEEADIIIFLVSADFLSTEYVWDIEIKTAIERDARGEAKVVPIVVRPCVWKDTPLWKFYSPEKATPISMAENRDAAWERVVVDLERIMVAGVEGGGL